MNQKRFSVLQLLTSHFLSDAKWSKDPLSSDISINLTSILLSWLCFRKTPTQVHVQYSCIILMRFKLLCKGNTRFQTQCPRKPKNCINFQCSLVRVYVSGRICGEYRTCLESCYVIVIDNPQLARSKFQFLHRNTQF